MKTESPQQKWNKANKEKVAAWHKEYYQANKEKHKAYCKEYNIANKENIKAQHKKYYVANKESQKDGLFTVYLLPKENYVGQTSCLAARLSSHKNRHKRNITGVWILGKYETRAEALAIEAEYHANGFKGYYQGI